MLSFRIAVVSGFLMFAIACGGGSSPAPAPSPTPTPTATSAVSIPKGAASLGNRAYTPDQLTVASGTTVTWMNTDSVSHTSTSDVSGWDSGIVAPGKQFSFTFQSAGTFSYHCAIHPGMVGKITVR